MIIQLIKKYWFLIILIFIIIEIYLLKRAPGPALNPSPHPSPNPILTIPSTHGSSSDKLVVSFVGSIPEFKSPLYSYTSTTPSSADFAAALASKMQLPVHPQSNYLWMDQQTSISLSNETGNITITENVPPTTQVGIPLSDSIGLASEYLANIGLDNVEFLTNKVVYANSRGEFKQFINTSSLNQTTASMVIIPFAYTQDSIPIYANASTAIESTIIVNSDQKVVKVSISSPPPVLTKQSQLSLISISSAVDKIKQGYGSYIYINSSLPMPMPAKNLVSLKFNQLELEYRLNTDQNTLIPYYHFYGQGDTLEDKGLSTETIVPAFQ